MNFKHLVLVTLCATSFSLAKADVQEISRVVAPENTKVKAAGKNLSKLSACFSGVNQDTGEITCVDLPVAVNSKKTRASITLPFVERDTKGHLIITSGKNAEEQSFFLLILDDQRSTVVAQANDPSLPENIGDKLVDAIKGEKGDAGPRGPQGIQGPKGDPGNLESTIEEPAPSPGFIDPVGDIPFPVLIMVE